MNACTFQIQNEQTNPFLTATGHAKARVRNPVEHFLGDSTQTTHSRWSYDNLCQLIIWFDNLRSGLEIENRKLM